MSGCEHHDHAHHCHGTGTKPAPVDVPPGVQWTCPMHAEVIRDVPGSCPICGMALEPMMPTAGNAPNPEYADMKRRFWIGTVLALPVFMLEMGAHLTGLSHIVAQQTNNLMQMALATPVVLWAGWPFFERGWQSLVTRNLNMFTLIAMGTGTAWAYSMAATLAPDIFPDAFRDAHGAVAVYFEAAAVITVLVLLGQVLELGRVKRPAMRSRRCSALRRRRRGVNADGRTRMSPSKKLSLAMCCACGPARRCRWTAYCTKVEALSTRR